MVNVALVSPIHAEEAIGSAAERNGTVTRYSCIPSVIHVGVLDQTELNSCSGCHLSCCNCALVKPGRSSLTHDRIPSTCPAALALCCRKPHNLSLSRGCTPRAMTMRWCCAFGILAWSGEGVVGLVLSDAWRELGFGSPPLQ